MVLLTDGHCGRQKAEDAAEEHGGAGEPSSSPSVEHEREERVCRELGRAGHGECQEDVQAEAPHVSHVAVEHQGDRHPESKTFRL